MNGHGSGLPGYTHGVSGFTAVIVIGALILGCLVALAVLLSMRKIIFDQIRNFGQMREEMRPARERQPDAALKPATQRARTVTHLTGALGVFVVSSVAVVLIVSLT